MRIYIFFISLLFNYFSFGQEIKNDSIKKKSIIHTLRFGTDLSKLVKSAIIEDYSAFEINADFKVSESFNKISFYFMRKKIIFIFILLFYSTFFHPQHFFIKDVKLENT